MAESTTIYTPAESAGVNSMLPWFLAGNRGGFGGNGSWSDLIALLVVWGIFGNNGFGNGFGGNGNAALANLMNNNDGRELLMQAINGNRSAISELAGTLNVSIASLQQSLNAVNMGIQSVGNQVGMSGMQVINAIQAGNCDLGNRLATCCCETRSLISQQGYENRLANLQQTDALASKIDQQTTLINDKFCQLEMRELSDKLEAARLENANLRGEISQANQNAYITNYIGQTVAPVAAQLTKLYTEVDSIKCKLPETVTVQYPNLVAMPTSTAYNLYTGNYGFGGNGFFG